MLVMKTIKQSRVEELIARLEDYPCTMSCHVNKDELTGARNMKETMIRIIKEELSEV